jgi:hypothetical protein
MAEVEPIILVQCINCKKDYCEFGAREVVGQDHRWALIRYFVTVSNNC